jgi:hypothetical protein
MHFMSTVAAKCARNYNKHESCYTEHLRASVSVQCASFSCSVLFKRKPTLQTPSLLFRRTFGQETHSPRRCSPQPQGGVRSLGHKKISKERQRLFLLANKLIAFWSSLLQHSYHLSSNQKIKFTQKFSPSQGKYIGSYTPSVAQPFCGMWLLSVLIWAVIQVSIVVSCDMIYQSWVK